MLQPRNEATDVTTRSLRHSQCIRMLLIAFFFFQFLIAQFLIVIAEAFTKIWCSLEMARADFLEARIAHGPEFLA